VLINQVMHCKIILNQKW